MSETQQRLGLSRKRLAIHLGVSLPALWAARAGRVPLVETVRRMTTAAEADPATTDRLLAWVQRQRLERSIRGNARARCRVCGGWEKAYKVRPRTSYLPPQGDEPASFLHEKCEARSAQSRFACPSEECRATDATRERFLSAKRKAAYRDRGLELVPGVFAVYCKVHNRSRQGQRQIDRMRTALKDRFGAAYEKSPYASNYSAEDVWAEATQKGNLSAGRIVAELLGLTPQPMKSVKGRKSKPSQPPTLGLKIGGGGGQVLKRWAAELEKETPSRKWSRWEKKKGKPRWTKCHYCPLCGRFVFGRRYHTADKVGRQIAGPALCWEVWRATPEYKRSSGRGHRPIDPPIPGFMGAPAEQSHIAGKLSWFLRRLAGESRKAIAIDAGLDGQRSAVTQGIRDIARRLPADWHLAYYHKPTADFLQERFPLPNKSLRRPIDEARIRWLTRWRMSEEAIRRLEGYETPEIREIIARPMMLDSALVRLVRTDSTGLGWTAEAWTGREWKAAAIPTTKILEKGKPASARDLRALGLPPEHADRPD